MTTGRGRGRHRRRRRPLRFAVIGAGMAGILSAIKLEEAGQTDFTVYEKADRPGGTWRENTYPGLSCDVPSHLYSLLVRTELRVEPHALSRTGDPGLLRGRRPATAAWCHTSASATRSWPANSTAGAGSSPRPPAIVTRSTWSSPPPACSTTPSTRRSRVSTRSPATMFHSARWDHSVALDGRARRHHRHGLDRRADRLGHRRTAGEALAVPAHGPVDHAGAQPGVHGGGTGRLPPGPGAPGGTAHAPVGPLRHVLRRRGGRGLPHDGDDRGGVPGQPRGQRRRRGPPRAASTRLPGRVQAPHRVGRLLPGHPATRTSSW